MLRQYIFWLFVCLFLSLFTISFNQNHIYKNVNTLLHHSIQISKTEKQNTRKYCILFTGSFLGCKHIQLLNDCKKDKANIYQANQYMYVAKCSFNGRFIEKNWKKF